MRFLKAFLKRILPERLQERLRRKRPLHPGAMESFSQEGEDRILSGIFHGQAEGFYVDVGAHHPTELSNTYVFYRKGWRGINIDPLAGIMVMFDQVRPRDINVEVAISDTDDMLTYYEFNTPVINTFSRELSQQRMEYGDGPKSDFRFELLAERKVATRRLADVLGEHMPAGQRIDFLSIDVEGHEMEVLRSNDWSSYHPVIVLIEDASLLSLDEMDRSPIVAFMRERGYVPFCRTPLTLIFVDKSELVTTPLGPRLRSIA